MSTSSTPQPLAVWFFIGATFVFAAPVIFFPDAPFWLRLVTLGLGMLLVIGGGVQLGREIRGRRASTDPTTENPATGETPAAGD